MTSANNDETRHAEISAIENYFEDNIDGVFSIEGTPPSRLVVAPSGSRLAVRVPAEPTAPDVSSFANISLDYIEDEGKGWHELSVRTDENLAEVYATLCSIVDRVQMGGAAFNVAVTEVVDSLSDILAKRRGLSDDQQLGLAGELISLLAVAHAFNFRTALDAWTGPLGEEHDFGLAGSDVEVKVTKSEKRHHWISSLSQLVPTPGRTLFVLSVQLTPAGAGQGWSLPDLVMKVNALSGASPLEVTTRLEGMGFRGDDSDLYPSRWALRTEPAFFLVDEKFPAISPTALDASVPSSNRILDIRYRIDLSGLPISEPLFLFDMLAKDRS